MTERSLEWIPFLPKSKISSLWPSVVVHCDFVSDLVRKPKDRFSHDVAPIKVSTDIPVATRLYSGTEKIVERDFNPELLKFSSIFGYPKNLVLAKRFLPLLRGCK